MDIVYLASLFFKVAVNKLLNFVHSLNRVFWQVKTLLLICYKQLTFYCAADFVKLFYKILLILYMHHSVNRLKNNTLIIDIFHLNKCVPAFCITLLITSLC